jgi:hypothetical protein
MFINPIEAGETQVGAAATGGVAGAIIGGLARGGE